jgi:hypothetical protein
LGLPEEISLQHKDITTIFGFSDTSLSAEIENAFQALAINETRADFVSTGISFVQTGLLITDHIMRTVANFNKPKKAGARTRS